MNYFFYKLDPPRSSFPADMTPEEGRLMQQHVAYWSELMQRGCVVVFGPVGDPKGTYGMAVIQLESGADPKALAANDPVIKADAGFRCEIHPMPRVMVSRANA